MALLFEIRLTHVQIMLLRQFHAWIASGREEKLSPFGDARFSHFVSTVKGLLRERLVVRHEAKKKTMNYRESAALWEITDKGIALLAVIDCELKESAKISGGKVSGYDIRQLNEAESANA